MTRWVWESYVRGRMALPGVEGRRVIVAAESFAEAGAKALTIAERLGIEGPVFAESPRIKRGKPRRSYWQRPAHQRVG